MSEHDVQLPMMGNTPWLRARDFVVFYRRLRLKLKRNYGMAGDITDNLKDMQFTFDEYPPCECCGSADNREVLIAADGNRVVECSGCGLWFTSPRVSEDVWTRWLLRDSGRSREFTENRLKYGDPLARNIPLSFSFWWRITRYRAQKHARELLRIHGGEVRHIHDVGCGVGFFLKACEELGMKVSGNDLNGYAVKRMQELFGFDVFTGELPDYYHSKKGDIRFDIIHMNDFIEHTYHPLRDLKCAFNMLNPGGLVFLRTFFVDSGKFARLGERWDMLMWNHVYHFTERSLSRLVEQAGFAVREVRRHEDTGIIELFGIKSS